MVSGLAPIRAGKPRYHQDPDLAAQVEPPPELDPDGRRDLPPPRLDDWSDRPVPEALEAERLPIIDEQ